MFFKVKFGAWTYSNVRNPMVLFTLSVLDWKDSFPEVLSFGILMWFCPSFWFPWWSVLACNSKVSIISYKSKRVMPLKPSCFTFLLTYIFILKVWCTTEMRKDLEVALFKNYINIWLLQKTFYFSIQYFQKYLRNIYQENENEKREE